MLLVHRGFIGPISDDLPSLIMIFTGLLIFFTSLNYAFFLYNQKMHQFYVHKGALHVSRVLLSQGVLPEDQNVLKDIGEPIAQRYGLELVVVYEDPGGSYLDDCYDPDNPYYIYSFPAPVMDSEDVVIKTLYVCVRE